MLSIQFSLSLFMALSELSLTYDPGIADLSIAEIVTRAGSGDEEAWESLVTRMSPLLWTVAKSFRLDEALARDVCQTVWVKLIESIGTIRRPDRIQAWLVTTCKREALRVKQAQAMLEPIEVPEIPTDTPDIDSQLIGDDDRRMVANAYARLDSRCRELLRLFAINPPLGYREIAETMGVAIGSVGPIRQRCVQRLRLTMKGPL